MVHLISNHNSQHPAARINSPKFETTLYVDAKNGLDTNDGLSEATALKTLKGTKDHIQSGTQILVKDGTYRKIMSKLQHWPYAGLSEYDSAGTKVSVRAPRTIPSCSTPRTTPTSS